MESERRLNPIQLRKYLTNSYYAQFWKDEIDYGVLDQAAAGEYLAEDEPSCPNGEDEDCETNDELDCDDHRSTT
jgi:hypothetical protein